MTAKPGIGTVAYNKICLSFLKKFHTSDRCAVCYLNADIRISLVKFLQIINEKITADRITGCDAQLTFQQIISGEKRLSFIQKLQCRFYVLKQEFPFRSQQNFFCASDKKRVVQFSFQSFDRLADR